MLDAHTSVVGMREVIRHRCRAICAVDFDTLQEILTDAESRKKSSSGDDTCSNDLFVVTAMSNFCGRKYPLEVFEQIHQWRPGIDAYIVK